MDQTLRDVAQKITGVVINFFCVEPDIVRHVHQLVHQLGRVVHASGSGESIDEPERAAEEGSLASREAVLAV